MNTNAKYKELVARYRAQRLAHEMLYKSRRNSAKMQELEMRAKILRNKRLNKTLNKVEEVKFISRPSTEIFPSKKMNRNQNLPNQEKGLKITLDFETFIGKGTSGVEDLEQDDSENDKESEFSQDSETDSI